MNYKNILVFDFETSGLNAAYEEVIEIGAILLEKIDNKYQKIDELSTLLKISKKLPEKITEITNITDEMLLKDGISQDEGFQKLYNLYDEDTLLIAYNIQFDLGFLYHGFRKYIDKDFEIKNDILDVMAIYKDFHFYPHRLESAIKTYNVDFPNSHRALDDAMATFQLLDKFREKDIEVKKFINLIGYNKKYGLSGMRLSHVTYLAQDGGRKEIYNYIK